MEKNIKKLISECADLNKRLIKYLPPDLHFLIWSSPTSVRNPEISTLWHPIHNRKNPLFRFFSYSLLLGLSIIRGVYKFFRYKGFYYYHIKNNTSVLLIIPEAITEGSNGFKTNYLTEVEEYPVDKLLLSHSGKRLREGHRFFTLSYFAKFNLSFKLLSAVLSDFRERLSLKKVNREYMDALTMFTCWVLAQSWYFILDFYHLLSKIVISNNYKTLLSLHEMHFYSRIIWKIAHDNKLLGVTAQHGLIIPEKLWYFPEISEVKANCPMPDIFFVYSDEVQESLQSLQSLYSETKFFRCCSPRFKHWKSFSIPPVRHDNQTNKRVVLIANNAAILHDVVVLKALRKLAKHGLNDSFILRLRLHPKEHLSLPDQLWVWMYVMLHRIEVSSKSLQEDFKEADLVIGANSTVLQEAVLMGIPALGVFDECYMASSILPPSFTCHINKLTPETLNQYIIKKPYNDLVKHFKTNMGIFNPDLTTRLIFETLEL